MESSTNGAKVSTGSYNVVFLYHKTGHSYYICNILNKKKEKIQLG